MNENINFLKVIKSIIFYTIFTYGIFISFFSIFQLIAIAFYKISNFAPAQNILLYHYLVLDTFSILVVLFLLRKIFNFQIKKDHSFLKGLHPFFYLEGLILYILYFIGILNKY